MSIEQSYIVCLLSDAFSGWLYRDLAQNLRAHAYTPPCMPCQTARLSSLAMLTHQE